MLNIKLKTKIKKRRKFLTFKPFLNIIIYSSNNLLNQKQEITLDSTVNVEILIFFSLLQEKLILESII